MCDLRALSETHPPTGSSQSELRTALCARRCLAAYTYVRMYMRLMHRCVSASSENVPSKFCCYCLQGDSDTLSARMHQHPPERELEKGVRYQDNFSSSFTQTFIAYMQKSENS